jgi:ABC-type Fe3+ transport system permease subunit
LTSHVSARRASLPARLGRVLAGWLPALPLLVFALATLVLPALRLVNDTFALRSGGYGLENVRKVIDNPVDREAIGNSLALGALQATLAAALGAPAAWLISRMRLAGRATWLALMNVAANFAGIGLAFGFVALIGTTGMLTHLLHVTFPSTASFTGINAAYLYFNVPMFVLLTLPAMSGIVSGSLLVVATAMNEFALAKILVGTRYETLPLWSAREFTSRTGNDPNALAVITIFTFGLLFALSAFVVWLGRARAPWSSPAPRKAEAWPTSSSPASPSGSAPTPRSTRWTSASPRARCWRCSARPAAARPRCCAASPG